MESLPLYLLKSAVILALFFTCFKLFLSRETFFINNRWYLQLGILISIALPLMVIKRYIEIEEAPSTIWTNIPVSNLSVGFEEPTWNWITLFLQIYFVGILFMCLRLLYQGLCIVQLIRSGEKYRENNFTHVVVKKKVLPFSFFNYIVYNPTQHTESDLEIILTHEKMHCRGWHSLDILGSQLFLIFQWFNPFAWLYQKTIAQNIEYLADTAALKQVRCKKNYQYVLLDLAVGTQKLSIINPFYNSLIKSRIFMLNKKKSTSKNYWKLLPVIPLIVLFVMLFNTETVAQTKKVERVEQQKTLFVAKIDKNTIDADLEKKSQTFKDKGVDLQFKKIKRNKAGEITGIRATYKTSEGKKGQYIVDDTNAINPFQVRAQFDGDKVSEIKFTGTSTRLAPPSRPASPAPPNAPASPSPSKVQKRVVVTANPSGRSRVKVISSGEDEDSIEEENTFVIDDEEFSWVEEAIEEGEEARVVVELLGDDIVKFKGVADSLRAHFIKGHSGHAYFLEDFDPSEMSKIIIKDFDIDADSLRKTIRKRIKIKGHGKNKDGNVFVFSGEPNEENEFFFESNGEAPQPIIIKDGEEIENIEGLSGDEIESISVLKGKKAVEKYGSKGIFGVIEIKGKKDKE